MIESGEKFVIVTISSSSSPEGFSKLFDRHVEMIGRIHGLWYFLAYVRRRGTRFRLPGGTHRDDWSPTTFYR